MVGTGTVNDPAHRTTHELDVIASSLDDNDRHALLAIGEVKWGETMGMAHLDRLRHVRDLLTAQGRHGVDVELPASGLDRRHAGVNHPAPSARSDCFHPRRTRSTRTFRARRTDAGCAIRGLSAVTAHDSTRDVVQTPDTQCVYENRSRTGHPVAR